MLHLPQGKGNHLHQPPRAHHCVFCDKCILKRDHHCPWIMNCVGYKNYKCFLMMLFWISISCLFIMGTYWMPFYYVMVNPRTSLIRCYVVTLEYLVSIAMGIAIIYFLSFHVWIICKGMTTAEYNVACHTDRGNPKSDYEGSVGDNLKDVFGDSLLEWLIPISMCVSRFEE